MWNSVIDVWKGIVVADYIKTSQQHNDHETMYKYMETFLGESAKGLWEAYIHIHIHIHTVNIVKEKYTYCE